MNHGIQVAEPEGNSHLQTGKKINEAKDDVGAFSVNAKINAELKQKTQRVQNLPKLALFLTGPRWCTQICWKYPYKNGGAQNHSSKLQPSMVRDKEIFDEEFKGIADSSSRRFGNQSLMESVYFARQTTKTSQKSPRIQFNLKAYHQAM